MKRRDGFLWLVPVYVVLLVLCGCTSSSTKSPAQTGGPFTEIPITNQIINETGGLDNTSLFQYYVSKTITLRLAEEARAATIRGGVLVERNETARQQIVIPFELPGLVRSYNVRNNGGVSLNSFEVAFENRAGDPVLLFGPYEQGSEERYELLFIDADQHYVQYGRDIYYVSWDGFEIPHLLIRREESSSDSSQSREASGLRLDG